MIKLFEMFAGYGGASFGLQKAGIEFECVGYSEIDKGAIKCYEQNHKGKNFGDCSKIDTKDLPDFDLLTGGFPCQDVSVAGKRDLNQGRTNLYLEILRILKDKKPKYVLLENVKGLLSMEVEERKLHHKITSDLQKLGYGVCWKVLNSKEHGTPQNRERIWFVCKLGGWEFMEFQFPQEERLKIILKDILEPNPDEKYYLNEKSISKIVERNKKFNMKGNRFIPPENDVFSTLTTTTTTTTTHDSLILDCYNWKGVEDVVPALTDPKHNNLRLLEKTRDVNQAIEVGKGISDKENKPVQLDLYHLQHGEIRPLSTYIPQNLDEHRCLQSGEPKEVLVYKNRVRKLTPKECFRLMGFFDDGINLEGLSDTTKYKLAGNGWDVNLVSKIFKNMIK